VVGGAIKRRLPGDSGDRLIHDASCGGFFCAAKPDRRPRVGFFL
jgi:hypothetical protein